MSKRFGIFSVVGMLSTLYVLPVAGNDVVFNKDWSFSLHSDSTCISPSYDDHEWRKLNIPHDWSIELPFDKNALPGNDGGYLEGGIGWYRKSFFIKDVEKNKRYQLYVGGAYMNSDVYLNGEKVGGHRYGYSPYFVDISKYLKSGKNVVVIRVDNSKQKNCRWYSGSGLYRDVQFIQQENLHISNWGVFFTTPDLSTLYMELSLDNDGDEPRSVDVSLSILGHEKLSSVTVPSNTKGFIVKQSIDVPEAKSWSPDSPMLYEANVCVRENGKTLDSIIKNIGFRTVEWNAAEGLKLNGEKILLNGGCVHHDNGILGAAAYPAAERRRVRLLKDAGFNAVRTSHNLSSEEFLDACDEYGLLVIDESFDGWRDAKNDHDYHILFDEHWQSDLDAMLLRDRNHPSVFCWSIGNEVIERDKIEVVTTANMLASRCRELDPLRPVTSALACWGKDWKTYDPLADVHDIVGYNYMIHESEKDHLRNPERVMVQTESFPKDAWSNYKKCVENPYIVGDFVWTAIDYIGESGIGRHYYEGDVPGEHFERPLYPWHASHCGDIDLTGYRKPISHYRSMLWNEDGEQLYLAVKEPDGYVGKIKTTMWGNWPTYESWNWPGYEGKPIEVEVYSHYPKVRLYLNDDKIAEKGVECMKATFELPYKEGVLRAEGIGADGIVKETKVLTTAGKPYGIRLTVDSEDASSDTPSMAFVSIEIVDKNGNVVPTADNELNVSVIGGGELIALGNADIKDDDHYYDSTHKAWHGRALGVLKNNGRKGNAKITVSSPGLKTSALKISFGR